MEHQMTSSLQQQVDVTNLALPTEIAMDITRKIAQAWKQAMERGIDTPVLLCDSRLRAPLAAMLARTVPMLPVIAYDEIILGTEIETVETVSAGQTEPQMPNQGRPANIAVSA